MVETRVVQNLRGGMVVMDARDVDLRKGFWDFLEGGRVG